MAFGLPHAAGVAVILNEHAQLIEPDYFVTKTWNMLRKTDPGGTLRYPENQVIIYISEAHRVLNEANQEMIPIETVTTEATGEDSVAMSFASEMRRRWAAFNRGVSTEWDGPIREVRTTNPAKLFKT